MTTDSYELPPMPEQHRVFDCLGAYKQGAYSFGGVRDEIERFAREYALLAVKGERERCARVCEAEGDKEELHNMAHYACCAAAIRGA